MAPSKEGFRMSSLYMKHMGLKLKDMRMCYEVDHERRLVYAELFDGFDSALFINFCKVIENQEGIRIINFDPFGLEHHIRYSIIVDAFGLSFNAELVRLAIDSKAVTVVLQQLQIQKKI